MSQENSAQIEGERLLENLVEALDGAFISVWQSTHYWQNEVAAAKEWLQQQKENRQ